MVINNRNISKLSRHCVKHGNWVHMYSYQTLKIFLSLLLMQEVDIEDDDDDDDSMDNETTEGDDQVNFF